MDGRVRELGKEENKHRGELEHGDRCREKEKEGSVSVMQGNNENMLFFLTPHHQRLSLSNLVSKFPLLLLSFLHPTAIALLQSISLISCFF